jgi:hypothetical protein
VKPYWQADNDRREKWIDRLAAWARNHRGPLRDAGLYPPDPEFYAGTGQVKPPRTYSNGVVK